MPLDHALKNRKDLIAREKQTAGDVLRVFQASYKRLESSLARVLADIENAAKTGKVEPSFLFEKARLNTLLNELKFEIDKLSLELGQITSEAQRLGVLSAIGETNEYLGASKALTGEIVGLDSNAMRELVGVGGKGEPLYKLFQRIEPELVARVRDALVSGVATGAGASAVAREIKSALGTSTAHALTIARTETLRSYRTASVSIYKANLITKFRFVSSLDLRTCIICWRYHGVILPTSEKPFLHINCRCAVIPVLSLKEKFTTGAKKFGKLDKVLQRQILGSARFELYEKGASLDSFVGEKTTEYGKMRIIKKLADL